MYRLHNLGVKRKVDWLVRNGKTEGKNYNFSVE